VKWTKEFFDPRERLQGDGRAHAWFGGPGEPGPGKKHECVAHDFSRHPDFGIVGLCTKKASPSAERRRTFTSRPLRFRPETGQKAKEQMNMKNVAKSVVLGLAALLASSAFASNKGTFDVRETVEINGQQVAPGEYQVRWDGTGSDVEVTFMHGKKEVAKTSAKLIALDKPYSYDSSVVEHTSGKAVVSEIRFGGKKYALAIGGTEKAEMGGGK
jgi:hypothetical protein